MPNRFALFLFFSLTSMGAYGQVNLNMGLVGCYAFTGNAKDGSGNESHGTVVGATLTSDRFGKQQSAYFFNGSMSYINIPTSQLTTDEYSYSVWMKVSSVPGTDQARNILSIGDNTSRHQTVNVANVYSSGQFTGINAGGYNNDGAPPTSLYTGYMPVIDQWYHVVSVRTHTEMQMFVNGVLVDAGSTFNNRPYYGEPVIANIGIRCNLTQPFHGVIDDVAIYDRPLNANEIQKLFADGLPCAGASKPTAENESRCGPGSLTLEAKNGTNYRWYNANGDFLFEGNPFATPHLSESMDFLVSNVANNTESEKITVSAVIFPLPEVVCQFPSEVWQHEEAMFDVTVTSGTPPFNYHFFFDDVSKETQSSNTYFTFPDVGPHEVVVLVTDANGCAGGCSEIVESRQLQVFIPNAITVNGDLKNELFTAFFKEDVDEYHTYDWNNGFFMQVYNRWGKEIFNTRDAISGWRATQEAGGMYYYFILIGENRYKGWLHVIK